MPYVDLVQPCQTPIVTLFPQMELERLRRKAEEEQLRQRQQAAELAAAIAEQRRAAAGAAAGAAAAAAAGSGSYGDAGPGLGTGADAGSSPAVQAQLRRTLKVRPEVQGLSVWVRGGARRGYVVPYAVSVRGMGLGVFVEVNIFQWGIARKGVEVGRFGPGNVRKGPAAGSGEGPHTGKGTVVTGALPIMP